MITFFQLVSCWFFANSVLQLTSFAFDIGLKKKISLDIFLYFYGYIYKVLFFILLLDFSKNRVSLVHVLLIKSKLKAVKSEVYILLTLNFRLNKGQNTKLFHHILKAEVLQCNMLG